MAAAAGIRVGALILATVAVAAGTGCFPGSRKFDCALMPGPGALPGMSTPPIAALVNRGSQAAGAFRGGVTVQRA